MKIATSYFYQIRHFKPYMIPVSTAISDPEWYRPDDGKEYYFDKRNIVNGLKYKPLIVHSNLECGCPCEEKDYEHCDFLHTYANLLQTVDFKKMIKAFEHCGNKFSPSKEPIIVLMVYEAPWKLCSERKALQNLFTNNGYECKELKYPIEENYE